MQDFDYVLAKDIDEVVALLSSSDGQARILSGGTDLLAQLREGRRTARLVVDIKRVPQANELCYDPQAGLVLGAAVSCSRICADPAVVAAYPGLVDAVSLIGGVQIQGRASVGGNVCNASPAADTIPALIVHRAVCMIAGPGGFRELPVEDFCTGPGQNSLGPGEFLVSLRVPPPPPRFGAHYLRFIPRNEMDIAVAGAAASVVLSPDGVHFEAARLALAAVAPVPLFVREAGEWLSGRDVSEEAIQAASEMAKAAVQPINDLRGTIDQRIHLAGVLSRRAIHGALDRAKGER